MTDTSSARLPGVRLRGFCVAAGALFFAYCVLLALESIAGFPAQAVTHTFWPWLGDKPVGEDGFYMLAIADNWARTGHVVYTYGQPTTGIQPLATVVFAGLAWLNQHAGGDRWSLIRIVLVFGSALFVGFAWLVARFTAALATDLLPAERRPLVFTLAFSLTLFDYGLWRLFTYGLETGLYLIAIVLTMLVWRRLVTANGSRWTNIALLGLAGGFAGEARIDFGLLLAFLLVSLVWKRYATGLQALVAGAIALALVSPWFLFVHSVSGAWLPSSGKAESRLIGLEDGPARFKMLALSAIGHAAPWTFAGASTLATTLLGLVSVALLAWLVARSSHTRRALRKNLRGTFAPWVAGLAALFAIYVLLFWSTHFYFRYTAPMLIVCLPLLALALAEQAWIARRIALVLAALILLDGGLLASTMHTGRVGNYILTAGYIKAQFPHARVGSFQSGVNGYFDPNVENLDGKVNTGALAALQSKRMPQFIDSEGIDVLVDWPGYLDDLPHDYLANSWQPCPVPMAAALSRCLIRKAAR